MSSTSPSDLLLISCSRSPWLQMLKLGTQRRSLKTADFQLRQTVEYTVKRLAGGGGDLITGVVTSCRLKKTNKTKAESPGIWPYCISTRLGQDSTVGSKGLPVWKSQVSPGRHHLAYSRRRPWADKIISKWNTLAPPATHHNL